MSEDVIDKSLKIPEAFAKATCFEMDGEMYEIELYDEENLTIAFSNPETLDTHIMTISELVEGSEGIKLYQLVWLGTL